MHDRKRVQGEFQIKIAQTDGAILIWRFRLKTFGLSVLTSTS